MKRFRGGKRFLALLVILNAASMPLLYVTRNHDLFFVLLEAFLASIFAQLGLLAVWTVWSPHALWQRYMFSLTSAALLLLACLGGLCASFLLSALGFWYYSPSSDAWRAIREVPLAFLVLLPALPAVGLALQMPLWACRLCFNWRIKRRDDLTVDVPLSIRDLLTSTAMVAIAFGGLRFQMAVFPWSDFGMQSAAAAELWLASLVFTAVLAGFSALLLVPLVATILRPSALRTACAAACALFCGVITAGWIAIATLASVNGEPMPSPAFALILGPIVAPALVIPAIPLFMAHHQGFRLCIGRRSLSPPPPLSPSP